MVSGRTGLGNGRGIHSHCTAGDTIRIEYVILLSATQKDRYGTYPTGTEHNAHGSIQTATHTTAAHGSRHHPQRGMRHRIRPMSHHRHRLLEDRRIVPQRRRHRMGQPGELNRDPP